MAHQPPKDPLDERVHQRPEIIQWYLANIPHAAYPMDENMIHRYIADSPFFDHVTNNGLAIAQAGTNQRLFDMTWDRAAFEEDLARKRGVEYRIVGTPEVVREVGQVNGAGVGGEGAVGKGGWAGTGRNGVYVIRKQERKFVRGRGDEEEEELTTLGTYYIIGENMYQAPSVGDVIGNRMLSATNHLTKFFETAANLPSFDSAKGYTYLPHASTTTTSKAHTTGTHSARSSVAPSPPRSLSREPSIVPGAGTDTHSLRSGSVLPDSSLHTNTSVETERLANRLLGNSLQLSLEFGSEYADENPLLGAPGNFSFTHSAAAVKKRRADEEKAAEEAAAKVAKIKLERDGSTTAAGVGEGAKKVVASPPAVMTESKAGGKEAVKEREREKDRRGSKVGDRARRKKSRAVNVVTPGSSIGGGGGSIGGGGSASAPASVTT